MEDGLRLKLVEALKAKYPDYLDLDEVENICKTYKYKISNLERRTRNDSKATNSTVKCQKIYNEKHTAIIGYRWIPDNTFTYSSPRAKHLDELDAQLREMLKGASLVFGQTDMISDIERALKSHYKETKQSVINRYRPS